MDHGTFYKILLFLHVVCVVAGFGALAWNALYVGRARGRNGGASGDPIDINAGIGRVAEFVIYAVFILGLLVVATSQKQWKFSQGWLSAAMALYIVDLGVLHGLIRRSQKEYRKVEGSLATAAGQGRPAEVDVLERLQQRIAIGWGIFDVIVLVVVWLMLFTPGAPVH